MEGSEGLEKFPLSQVSLRQEFDDNYQESEPMQKELLVIEDT